MGRQGHLFSEKSCYDKGLLLWDCCCCEGWPQRW